MSIRLNEMNCFVLFNGDPPGSLRVTLTGSPPGGRGFRSVADIPGD